MHARQAVVRCPAALRASTPGMGEVTDSGAKN